uniref:Uncharacterized protein n=1 Tax=Brassica oleracea TaxID=3712 RepID=A0A3P6C929_BRAOL|nr:unnamed protein product [Brassica oleracea]
MFQTRISSVSQPTTWKPTHGSATTSASTQRVSDSATYYR